MALHSGISSTPHTLDGILHHPGQTFDRDGNRTPFVDLVLMDGLFSVDDIADRLPFRLRTLRNWARKGPFSTCFKRVHFGPCGNSILLVDLNLLATMFEEIAEGAQAQDSLRTIPVDPAMEDISGLHEFAELVISNKHSYRQVGCSVSSPAVDHQRFPFPPGSESAPC